MDRALTAATLLGLAWGVLSFGAVYAWAYWPLIALVSVVGVFGLVSRRGGTRPDRRDLVKSDQRSGPTLNGTAGLSMALTALCLATVLQLVPVPATTLVSLSPATDRFLRQYDLAYAAATAADTPAVTHPVSINPGATLLGLVFLIGFGVLLVGLAMNLSQAGARRLGLGVVTLGLVVAVIGIVQRPLFSGKIYGFWEPRFSSGGVFGPFVNGNHFAGWMMMALSLSTGYFCGSLAQAMRGIKTGWRNRVLWFSSPGASKLLLGAFALVVMALSLVLSLSRSGIACMTLALVLAAGLVVRRLSGGSRRAFAASYLGFVLVVAVGWAGIDAVAGEFAVASWGDIGGRLGAWKDAVSVSQDFPLMGTGLNTYRTAMVLYQTFEVDRNSFWAAHNDYLQLAAEGGLLLGLPAFLVVVVFVRTVSQRFKVPSDDRTYWLRVGSVIGILAIALQEVVEFSLQIPGNAALFSVLCAVALHAPEGKIRHGLE